MVIRLEGKEKDLVIIQVYVPSSQYGDEEEVEECYERIEELIDEDKKGVWVIVMEDWNAVVGEREDNGTVGNLN